MRMENKHRLSVPDAPWKQSRAGQFVTDLVGRYFAHDVGRQSAALAYYLLFTIFPLLIFLSSLLGLLKLDIGAVMRTLQPLLPESVVELLEVYLLYVTETSSRTMLWFGLVFTIYFPTRAADCLARAVRRAYDLPPPGNSVLYTGKVLLYTVFLLIAGIVTLFLATVGQRVLAFVGQVTGLNIPDRFIIGWSGIRFLVMGVVAFGAVGLLYAASQDRRQLWVEIIPGTLCAVVGWMLLSAAYSFYVENFGNYSVIYGTLGAVIVLMIWLSLTATVLILGAEVNGVLGDMRRKNKQPGGARKN